MIIGITGYAGSGKDTVADILVRDHGFVKVAFADPLKRICKDLFAFTDAQLWGSSSKRNEPDLRYPREHSTEVYHGQFCICCGADLWGGTPAVCFLTPRHALQQLGTEWARSCYEDVWVEYALKVAAFLLCGAQQTAFPPNIPTYYPQLGKMWLSACAEKTFHPSGYGQRFWAHDRAPWRKAARGVVISDVRFPNEVAALRAKGARIWRTTHGDGLVGAPSRHESERHIVSIKADHIVPAASLETLPTIVMTLLKGGVE